VIVGFTLAPRYDAAEDEGLYVGAVGLMPGLPRHEAVHQDEVPPSIVGPLTGVSVLAASGTRPLMPQTVRGRADVRALGPGNNLLHSRAAKIEASAERGRQCLQRGSSSTP
jgi:hypothetical protein